MSRGSLQRAGVHFNYVCFGALDEGDDFIVFDLRNLKFLQRRVGLFEEDVPITFADAHTFVTEFHVAAPVIHRAAGRGAEKIDEELAFPLQAVLAAMLPEAAKLRVCFQAVHQIVAHSGDGVVTAQPFVEGCVARGSSLPARLGQGNITGLDHASHPLHQSQIRDFTTTALPPHTARRAG